MLFTRVGFRIQRNVKIIARCGDRIPFLTPVLQIIYLLQNCGTRRVGWPYLHAGIIAIAVAVFLFTAVKLMSRTSGLLEAVCSILISINIIPALLLFVSPANPVTGIRSAIPKTITH